MNGEVVIMFLSDVDRILRLLYNGSRPPGVRFLICSCGHSANLTAGDAQWLGWQILPNPMCPDCLNPQPYTGPARDRYMDLVNKLLAAGKVG